MHCCYLQVFQKFQGLDDEPVLFQLLSEVASGKKTIHKAGKEAADTKLLNVIKPKIAKLAGVSSWEEATEKFPVQATEENLREFLPFFRGEFQISMMPNIQLRCKTMTLFSINKATLCQQSF